MTQCAKIIVGCMANVGNVFYPTFANVFFNFHLNVYYYIYGISILKYSYPLITFSELGIISDAASSHRHVLI